ncbi:MAG: DUF4407 domain-containing protein [Prevotellaceae bacterium]|jgi:hypothetical protein|nr:DUF4407 domain-containing protein [Prevotellaceae bacterium]
MKRTLYKIGGYDPKIVKAGRLGSKFMLPGLSLLIVLITSSYGGYHLADTITSGWYRILFTAGFVSLILLVDYLLLHGEKSLVTGGMRVLLSITMGFIISLLTCLVAFESDISAKYNTNITSDVELKTATRKKDIAYWKTLPDSISKYNNLSVKAHKGDYVTEHGEPIGKCKDFDQSKCPEGTYCRDFKNRADYFKNIYEDNKRLINDKSYEDDAQKEAESRNSKGIIGQIENLWNLMMNEKVVLVGVILFFVFLMVIDLMPISVKFGIKDKLDAEYKTFIDNMRTETNPDGTLRWCDVEKEHFLIENEKMKARLEEEKQKEIKESERKQANIAKLEEVKQEYADKKLQYVKDEIDRWHSNSQSENNSPTVEDTIIDTQNVKVA